jgi:hypothetical protein
MSKRGSVKGLEFSQLNNKAFMRDHDASTSDSVDVTDNDGGGSQLDVAIPSFGPLSFTVPNVGGLNHESLINSVTELAAPSASAGPILFGTDSHGGSTTGNASTTVPPRPTPDSILRRTMVALRSATAAAAFLLPLLR